MDSIYHTDICEPFHFLFHIVIKRPNKPLSLNIFPWSSYVMLKRLFSTLRCTKRSKLCY